MAVSTLVLLWALIPFWGSWCMYSLTFSDWVNAIGTILIPAAVATLAAVQWRSDRKASERQEAYIRDQHAKDNAHRERERDENLLNWAIRVIDVMAEVESECRLPPTTENKERDRRRSLYWRSSSLVDQGRLFFPNIATEHKIFGYRPKLLDEVVRSAFIANSLQTCENEGDMQTLALHISDTRRRFIMIFQEKTKRSLLDVNHEDIGERIDPNPLIWIIPEHKNNRHYRDFIRQRSQIL